jgi:TM2 domain-containing membrane protein YozV
MTLFLRLGMHEKVMSMKSLMLSYLLWLLGGPLGIYKFYLGRPFVGLLYMVTGGLFMVGWIVDFFTLPRQVRVANLLQQNQSETLSGELQREMEVLRRGLHDWLNLEPGQAKTAWRDTAKQLIKPRLSDDDLMLGLLKAAKRHGGRLSVTDGVIATGAPFSEVERVLNAMLSTGYVYMDNDATTGVVVYVFQELF